MDKKIVNEHVMNIGSLMRKYRREYKKTQKEWAVFLNIGAPTIAKVESDKNYNAGHKVIRALLGLADISIKDRSYLEKMLSKQQHNPRKNKLDVKTVKEIEDLASEIALKIIAKLEDGIISRVIEQFEKPENTKVNKKNNSANEAMQLRSFSSDFSTTARAINLLFKLKMAPVEYFSELILLLSSNNYISNLKMEKGIKETAEGFIDMGNKLLKIIERPTKFVDIIEEE